MQTELLQSPVHELHDDKLGNAFTEFINNTQVAHCEPLN